MHHKKSTRQKSHHTVNGSVDDDAMKRSSDAVWFRTMRQTLTFTNCDFTIVVMISNDSSLFGNLLSSLFNWMRCYNQLISSMNSHGDECEIKRKFIN